MTDILVPDVPQETIDGLAAQARRDGLTLNDYLLRLLASEVERNEAPPPA